ncbi:MAG TPA: hypothetical protein ENI80_09465 [Acidiferrobacteraceae bacterium]|nr:hypothetical protein [Acidiferrobacteraceae bacterium]
MINIVTALRCEAKPLIHHLNLKGEAQRNGFRIYSNNSTRLVISGVGKTAAAKATAYLQDIGENQETTPWLNIGVAGHPSKPVGDVIITHKLTDEASGHTVFPQLVFDPPCASECLLTVDRPMPVLPADTMVDMEAFGFYSTAIRFATRKQVHCLKVISDNGANPENSLSAKQIEVLVQDAMVTINTIIVTLEGLADRG